MKIKCFKKYVSLFCALIFTFSINFTDAFAAEVCENSEKVSVEKVNKVNAVDPSDFPIFAGGDHVDFTGKSVTFSFTLDHSVNNCMIETRVNDWSGDNSYWEIKLTLPKGYGSTVLSTSFHANSDYSRQEYLYLPNGTYTVTGKMVSGTTSSSEKKGLTVFIWTK